MDKNDLNRQQDNIIRYCQGAKIMDKLVAWSRRESYIMLAAILITVVTAPIAIALAGDGHGTYLPFSIFSPWSGLLMNFGLPIVAMLGIGQNLIYGIIIIRAYRSSKYKDALARLFFIHVVAALVTMALSI